MFADNHMISRRQLKRQMVLSSLGILLLFGTGEIAWGGGNAVLGFILGTLLILAYLFLLVQTSEVYSYPERYLGIVGKWVITAVYLSFLALGGSVLLEEVSLVIRTYLLTSVPQPVISAAFLAAAFVGMGQRAERRGRLAEVSYPWVLGFFIVMLVLASFHLRGIRTEDMDPWNAGKISRETVRVFAAGTFFSLLPFSLGRVKEKEGNFRVLRRGIWLLLFLTLAAAGILISVYGWKGVKNLEYPILNLMTGTGLPGGFPGRVDIIWLAVLLFALLFSMGSILFYGDRICRRDTSGSPCVRLVLAAVIWLGSFIRWNGTAVSELYSRLLQDVYAPVFVGITLLAIWAKRRVRNEEKQKREG